MKVIYPFFCLVAICVLCSFDAQHLRKFLENNKDLTFSQKLKILDQFLQKLEKLHQDGPVRGPITVKDCLIANDLTVYIRPSKSIEAPIYSLQHHIQNVGWILSDMMQSKQNELPTVQHFKKLIESMKNPDILVRITLDDLKHELQKIVHDHKKQRAARKNARSASVAIMKLCKKTALTKKEIFKMALFIETKLQDRVERKGRFYFGRQRTGLARTIEVDPKSKEIFIHLKKHGVDELGRGARKVVTKSIQYSPKFPKIIALSETTFANENEAQAIIDLQGLPGLYRVFSILDRKSVDGGKRYAFISKYYPEGDLDHYLRTHKLRFNRKLQFARDILLGVENMHAHGYAHRDLGLKNYFVEKQGKRVFPVIADFGRAVLGGQTEEKGAQGGYSLCAPEGLDYESLQGDDYLATDIYALGCIFYRILHDKKHTWTDVQLYGDSNIPVHERFAKYKNELEQFRQNWQSKLENKYTAERALSTRKRFYELVIKMIDPDPKKRGCASELRQRLDKILKRDPL